MKTEFDKLKKSDLIKIISKLKKKELIDIINNKKGGELNNNTERIPIKYNSKKLNKEIKIGMANDPLYNEI
jgi:DNA-binding IscR family transcriptional regulator